MLYSIYWSSFCDLFLKVTFTLTSLVQKLLYNLGFTVLASRIVQASK